MSIEEMISWLSQKPYSAAIPGRKADAIIAALRRLEKLEALVEAAKAWAWVHEPSTMQEQELADALTATGEDV